MTQQITRRAGRFTAKALLGAALLGLVTTAGTLAQTHVYAHNFTRDTPVKVYKPHSLEVAVYQLENLPKFKVHFENHDDSPVIIRLKNAANHVLHEEVVRDGKYVRKFDLAKMADGYYTFEIANKKESIQKEIQLQTLAARTLQILQ